MRYLRTNTAARITVGPFFDKTDGVTPEVALTVTSCHLTLMVDAANVPTLVLDATATASGGDNDMVHVTNDDAGFYDLELTQAQTNYLGRAMLAITDAATHCPVFHEFMILPAMVYDSLILGTDLLDTENSAGVATMVADYARRTGDYATVGAKMDIADAPSATGVAVIVSAIWDKLLTGITQAGSVGKLIKDYLDAAVSTRSAPATAQTITAPADMALNSTVAKDATVMKAAGYTAPDNAGIAAIQAKTDNLPAAPAAVGDAMTLAVAYDAAKTAAQAGDKMDIVDAPNATAVTAIQNGLSKPGTSQIADVRKVNNVTITGDGNATPWGPA